MFGSQSIQHQMQWDEGTSKTFWFQPACQSLPSVPKACLEITGRKCPLLSADAYGVDVERHDRHAIQSLDVQTNKTKLGIETVICAEIKARCTVVLHVMHFLVNVSCRGITSTLNKSMVIFMNHLSLAE